MNDGRHDFDFLIGDWNIHNTRLKSRLSGDTEWEVFEATSSAGAILNGLGHIDEFDFGSPMGGMKGFSLGVFNPQARQWYLYWTDSVAGELSTPMVGEFDAGIGEFFAHEVFENRRVFSRHMWFGVTAHGFRWERAYSIDGGKTWETNWTMDYSRAPVVGDLDLAGAYSSYAGVANV